jgi:hypothetical protein
LLPINRKRPAICGTLIFLGHRENATVNPRRILFDAQWQQAARPLIRQTSARPTFPSDPISAT